MTHNVKTFTLIDLFCGCGGFSAGFVYPPIGDQRWKVKLGVDINTEAINTFATNFGEETVHKGDLTDDAPEYFFTTLGLKRGELDHLHASPPCEDYSVNNRVNGSHSDPRFRIVLKWTEVFLPKVVTIENVHNLEMAHDEEIKKFFTEANYIVISFKLDAADYGVPQHRRRLFYFAAHRSLGKRPYPPPPTHCNPHRIVNHLKPWVTVKEAINDLPPRNPGENLNNFTSRLDPKDEYTRKKYGTYACSMRPQKGATVTCHYARPLNDLAIKRLRALKQGQAIWDLPLDLRPRNGFRGAYGRLDSRTPAKTITTGVRGPSHGPFCHYSQDRLITIREGARLQSFPDSFIFLGGKISQAFLVGNAVPPLLSRAIQQVSTDLIEANITSVTQRKELINSLVSS
jgi:DNA (cytosine-5)-methyltransferase 1